jgi:hypothetical protein
VGRHGNKRGAKKKKRRKTRRKKKREEMRERHEELLFLEYVDKCRLEEKRAVQDLLWYRESGVQPKTVYLPR